MKRKYITRNESDKALLSIIDDLNHKINMMKSCQNCKHSVGVAKTSCDKIKSCTIGNIFTHVHAFDDYVHQSELWCMNE